MNDQSTPSRDVVLTVRIPRRAGVWLGIGLLASSAAMIWSISEPEVRSGTADAQQPTITAAPVQFGDVHALARIEPLAGLIIVGARPGARIQRIEVAQGASVAAGQLLAILEGHDQALAQRALAEVEKTRAIHQRSVGKHKLVLERERFDKLQKARTDQSLRVLASKALFDQITASFKQLQPNLQGRDGLDTQLKYLEAENRNIKDSLEVRSYQIAGELVPRQRKLEDDELGEKSPDLDVLDRQIDLARMGVAQTEVHAPSAGQVLEVTAHAGEVSSGPLLAMGDVSAMAAIAEVFQADVPRLKIGDAATVQILDQSVAGHVTQIGTMVARNQLTNVDPRALQDRRVVKASIRLADSSLAAKLINMEVEVAISPSQAATATSRASAP
jgi:HlyD family secretion protein